MITIKTSLLLDFLPIFFKTIEELCNYKKIIEMWIGMMKNVFLLILTVIGAFMVVITSNKLGEQGNRVMTFMGSIIYLSAVFSIIYLSRKRDQN
ncbi:hypothetical protein AV656_11525 [Bhargavaea cecembensis]|uniref:Uncharacterized protein n=1 Tax=Bhargavaea cecembensis TaxID=394098 RepID=A0A161RCF3_9BACL|nr:hypothetical protein AV656_11525 [Bhargavaea cecembensis]